MKKILTLSILAFSFLFFGCGVEVPTSFGVPEGLWFYSGNERCLSDGSQKEEIVTNVMVDNVQYGIEIVNYKYFENNIYFNIKYDNKHGLFFYDIKEKNLKLIYPDYAYSIVFMNENYILIKDYHNNYILIDHNGNVLEEDAYSYKSYYFIDSTYIGNANNNTATIKKWGEENFTTIFEADNVNEKVVAIVKCGNNLRITTKIRDDLYGFYIYNMNEQKIIAINNPSLDEYAKIINDDYYMTYKITKYQNAWTPIISECKLYKYENGAMQLQYTFPADYNCKDTKIVDDYLNVTVVRYKNNDIRYSRCYLNLETLKLKKGLKTSENVLNYKLNGHLYTNDEYIFYQYSASAGIISSTKHQFVYRYNIKTEEDEVMQYKLDQDRFYFDLIYDY